MKWMRYVVIPDDAKVYIEFTNGFRCDKFILSDKHNITLNDEKRAVKRNGLSLRFVKEQTE